MVLLSVQRCFLEKIGRGDNAQKLNSTCFFDWTFHLRFCSVVFDKSLYLQKIGAQLLLQWEISFIWLWLRLSTYIWQSSFRKKKKKRPKTVNISIFNSFWGQKSFSTKIQAYQFMLGISLEHVLLIKRLKLPNIRWADKLVAQYPDTKVSSVFVRFVGE